MTYFNPDIIADNYSLLETLSEKVIEQYDDLYNNDIRGKETFTSKVVSDGPKADRQHIGNHFFCKARPINTMHDHCTPDPCSEDQYTPAQRKSLISMQQTIVSKNTIGQHDRPPLFGDSVEISFFGEGPNASSSKMRDPRYEPKSKKEVFRYGCASKQVQSVVSSFFSGIVKQLGGGAPTTYTPLKSTNTIQPKGWTHYTNLIMNDKSVEFMNKLRQEVPSHIPIHCNSMQRSPIGQANAMLYKINAGSDLVSLYTQTTLIKEVLDAAGVKYTPRAKPKKGWIVTAPKPNFKRHGADAKKMAAVISQQMARGKYLSPHLLASAVDIRTTKWPKSKRNNYIKIVLAAAKKLNAASAIYETSPPHIHLSVKR